MYVAGTGGGATSFVYKSVDGGANFMANGAGVPFTGGVAPAGSGCGSAYRDVLQPISNTVARESRHAQE